MRKLLVVLILMMPFGLLAETFDELEHLATDFCLLMAQVVVVAAAAAAAAGLTWRPALCDTIPPTTG